MTGPLKLSSEGDQKKNFFITLTLQYHLVSVCYQLHTYIHTYVVDSQSVDSFVLNHVILSS